jgi:hypothetical protein
MGIIKQEEIMAFRFETGVVCKACLAPSDKPLREENILLQSEHEEDYVFCDRCKEMI